MIGRAFDRSSASSHKAFCSALPAIVFCLVFGPKVLGYSLGDVSFITACVIIVMIGGPVAPRRPLPITGGALAILAGFSCALTVFSGALSLDVALAPVRALVVLYASGKIVRLAGSDRVVGAVIWAGSAHAVLVALMAVSPSIRDLIYGAVGTLKITNATASMLLGYRVPGLTYGLAVTSAVHAIVVVLAMDRRRLPRPGWARVGRGFHMLVNALAILFLGRSGFVVLLFGVCYMLVRTLLRSPRSAVMGIMSGVFLLACATIVVELVAGSLPDTASEYISEKYLETWDLLIEDPALLFDREVSQLANRTPVLPRSPTTALLGSGHTGREGTSTYVDSDSGYVLAIYSTGLVGLVLILSAYAGPVIGDTRRWMSVSGAVKFMWIVPLILELKGGFLLSRNLWAVQALVLCAAMNSPAADGTEERPSLNDSRTVNVVGA